MEEPRQQEAGPRAGGLLGRLGRLKARASASFRRARASSSRRKAVGAAGLAEPAPGLLLVAVPAGGGGGWAPDDAAVLALERLHPGAHRVFHVACKDGARAARVGAAAEALDGPLSLEVAAAFAARAEEWWRGGPGRAVVLRCPEACAAELVAAALYYAGRAPSPARALETCSASELRPARLVPSRRRFLDEFAAAVAPAPAPVPEAAPPLVLRSVRVTHLPQMSRRRGGIRPMVTVMQGNRFLYTTMLNGAALRWVRTSPGSPGEVTVPINVPVSGAAVVRVYHQPEYVSTDNPRRLLFLAPVQTAAAAAAPARTVTLRRDDIDGLAGDRAFSRSFSVEVAFDAPPPPPAAAAADGDAADEAAAQPVPGAAGRAPRVRPGDDESEHKLDEETASERSSMPGSLSMQSVVSPPSAAGHPHADPALPPPPVLFMSGFEDDAGPRPAPTSAASSGGPSSPSAAAAVSPTARAPASEPLRPSAGEPRAARAMSPVVLGAPAAESKEEPRAEETAAGGGGDAAAPRLVVGHVCSARWTDRRWYPAVVNTAHEDGTFTVTYTQDGIVHRVGPADVEPLVPAEQQPTDAVSRDEVLARAMQAQYDREARARAGHARRVRRHHSVGSASLAAGAAAAAAAAPEPAGDGGGAAGAADEPQDEEARRAWRARRAMSVDELLARELQAQWEGEDGGGRSLFADAHAAASAAAARPRARPEPRHYFGYRGRRGASSRQISELPEFPCAAGSKYLDDDCLVCRERFQEGDVVRLLPCIHVYHRDCIDQWLATNRTCPTCTRRIDQHQ